MKKYLLTYCLCIFSIYALAQSTDKLIPDNTIKIIGTELSVDYNNNNQTSTTVNTKAHAFDGNFNTFFASHDRSFTWLGLDLGEKHVITQVGYCPRKDWSQRLELGVFEGANRPDFMDAVILCVIINKPEENKITLQSVDNSRGFRYVRYIGPNDVRCNIAEVEFYGYKAEGNDNKLTQVTNIPDVIIHTENNRTIPKDEKKLYVPGTITFISEDGTQVAHHNMGIRVRGNASREFEKRPYKIKLENKAFVLDNPAEAKNWTLISNHGDKTLMRNLLAFDLSKRFDMEYTPAGQPVNVYLNGEYQGCYQLCDHIDVREHRVDIKEMKTTDISGEALTGGYLLEIDAYADSDGWDLYNIAWFKGEKNIPVTIKSPEDDAIVPAQTQYIKDHFNKWVLTVYSFNYTHPELGYRRYMDTASFIRHFLVGELSGNTDTYWSVFMYKHRNNNVFYYGPVWDFDLAYDNDYRTYPVNNLNDWIYNTNGSAADGMRLLVNRLFSDNTFADEVKQTWADYRDWGIITEENLLSMVDRYAQEMNSSQQMNFKRWDIINSWVHMINHNTGSYEGEVAIVKTYIRNRIAWMDRKLEYVPNPRERPTSTDTAEKNNVHVRTSSHAIHLYGIEEPTSYEIINMMGQTIERDETNSDTSITVDSGAYIVRLHNRNAKANHVKCLVR